MEGTRACPPYRHSVNHDDYDAIPVSGSTAWEGGRSGGAKPP